MEKQTISYVARAEPAPEGGYVITIPDLGCVTQGNTLKEAKEMAKDAMIGYLSVLKDDGIEFPPAKYRLRKDLKIIKQFRVTAELTDLVEE